MTLDRDDAAAALASVARTRERSAALRHYSGAASTVLVWGLIWLICNLLTQFADWGAKSWMAGVPIGVLWSVLHPLRPYGGANGRVEMRIPLSIFAAFAFLWLVMLITEVRMSSASATTLVSLLVAVSYVIAGIWVGARIALLGVALTVAICLGWFVFPQWLFLWLGLGGGGALILGGLWLGRA